jgi:hypothetical protein
MRVIIKNNFYEFQNEKTDEIFESQKMYLSEIIAECEKSDDQERLLTTLFSLYNLTEALVDEYVDKAGLEGTVRTLKARSVK